MNKVLTTLSLTAVLVASGSAFADNANPDAVQPKPIAPAHFFLSVGTGASFSSVDLGSIHFLSLHAHVDLGIGHELFAGALGTDRVSLALGYVGAADFNAAEVLHHHGVGVTFRKNWFYVTLDGGVAVVNGFDYGSFVGGHLGVHPGFRFGPVQLGFPVSVDFFSAPASTFAATLGFQM